jgi:hypothetical protein
LRVSEYYGDVSWRLQSVGHGFRPRLRFTGGVVAPTLQLAGSWSGFRQQGFDRFAPEKLLSNRAIAVPRSTPRFVGAREKFDCYGFTPVTMLQ